MIKKVKDLYKLILEGGEKIEVYKTEKEARQRLEQIEFSVFSEIDKLNEKYLPEL